MEVSGHKSYGCVVLLGLKWGDSRLLGLPLDVVLAQWLGCNLPPTLSKHCLVQAHELI